MNRVNESERSRVALKTLAVAGMFCLLMAVSILNFVPPADGYEISIYQVYPWYFWGLLIGSIFLGQTVIFGSVRYGRDRDKTWIFGLGLVLLSGAILLFMPFIRGYPVFGGLDELTHIGYVHDISQVGISGNIYPAMHLLVHSGSLATGLPPEAIMKLLPIVQSFVFVGGMFYLVRNFEDGRHALYALPFILTLFIGYKTAVPFVLSVLFVPFIMYLFVKEQRTSAVSIRLFLIISIFGMIFFHPLTSIFLILTLGIYVGLEKTNRFDTSWTKPTMVPSLTVVVFSTWYLAFLGIIRRFERTAQRLTGAAEGVSELDTVTETVNTFSPDPVDLATIAVLEYGMEAVFYTFAGLFILLAGYLWLRGRIQLNIFTVLFSGVFVLFTALSGLFFINDFGVGWGRVLFFQNAFVAILGGMFVYYFYQYLDSNGLTAGLTVSLGVVLFILTVIVVFSSFASIPAKDYNSQATEMNIDGAEWVLDNRDDETVVDQHRIALWRYEHFHNGTLTETVRDDKAKPPDHFGYRGNETIGQAYDENRYLIITELGRLTYPEIYADYPEFWRYTPDDFDRLDRDRTAARIYDNGEFDFYYVTAEERGFGNSP